MRSTLLTLTLAALVATPVAGAHVSITPSRVPANSEARFVIRVPNEEAAASTTRITVQLPRGLRSVSVRAKPGWRRTVTRASGRIVTITWSAGAIPPGQAATFAFAARVPNKPGRQLVFPAVQRYSNGVVARWIGAPDAEHPAPRVDLGPARKGSAAPTTTEVTTTQPAATKSTMSTDPSVATIGFTAAPTPTGAEGDDVSTAGVILLGAGVTAGIGLLGLVLFRRRRS